MKNRRKHRLIKTTALVFTIIVVLYSLLPMVSYAKPISLCQVNNDKANTGDGKNPQKYSEHWEYWSQGASSYELCRSVGCYIIAQAKMLVEMGLVSSNPDIFNPDVLWEWGVENGTIDHNGNDVGNPCTAAEYIKEKSGITITVTTKTVFPSYYSSEQKSAEILNQVRNDNTYIIINRNTRNDHFMYIAKKVSIDYNKAVLFNSWKGWSVHESLVEPVNDYIDSGNVVARMIVFTNSKDEYIKDSCTVYPAYADITVYAYGNAAVKALPLSNDGAAKLTLESRTIESAKGKTYRATGLVRNSYGNLWYQVTAGNGTVGYVYSGDLYSETYLFGLIKRDKACGIKPLYTDIRISGVNEEALNTRAGKTFLPSGVISCDYNSLCGISIYTLSDSIIIDGKPEKTELLKCNLASNSVSLQTLTDPFPATDLGRSGTYCIDAEILIAVPRADGKTLETQRKTIHLFKAEFEVSYDVFLSHIEYHSEENTTGNSCGCTDTSIEGLYFCTSKTSLVLHSEHNYDASSSVGSLPGGQVCYVKRKSSSSTFTHVTYKGLDDAICSFNFLKPVDDWQIIIDSLPDKSEYQVGEPFDASGLKIRLDYNYKNIYCSETVSDTALAIRGFDGNTCGLQTITVEYAGKSVAFTVNVTQNSEQTKAESAGGPAIMEFGDITGDDKVNNKDVTRLLQSLAGWNVTINRKLCDVNGDGKLNNKDVTRLLQYLAGWSVEIFANEIQ